MLQLEFEAPVLHCWVCCCFVFWRVKELYKVSNKTHNKYVYLLFWLSLVFFPFLVYFLCCVTLSFPVITSFFPAIFPQELLLLSPAIPIHTCSLSHYAHLSLISSLASAHLCPLLPFFDQFAIVSSYTMCGFPQ